MRRFTEGYLLIGCLRRFGGLHSPTRKDRVEITLNGHIVDGFELQHIPHGHRDYFHETPYPKAPRPAPFALCNNLYAWHVPRTHLKATGRQRLGIRLSRDAKWDIDYLGFLFKLPPPTGTVFISYSAKDRPLARRLAKDLRSLGIGVWFDEEAIDLGDSLLERISDGIQAVDFLLVVLSRHSVRSRWVREEVLTAMTEEVSGKRVKVLVVRTDNAALPPYLVKKRFADLRDPKSYRDVLGQIERRLARR